MVIEVSLIFIVLASILLWFVIGSSGRWWAKLVAITATVLFSLNIARSLENLAGWPAEVGLPDKFLIHWALARSPNKASGEPGAIFLWISEADGELDDSYEFFRRRQLSDPRSYRLPFYSEDMHETIMEIQEIIKSGRPVTGAMGPEEDGGLEPGGGGFGSLGAKGGEVRLYDLPSAGSVILEK